MLKTQTVLLGMAMILSAAVAQGQGSALDAHRGALGGALEDGSMNPFEARLLEAMTPEQAEAFAAGEDPRAIVLESGETLASFIAALLAGGQGLVYVPLDSCLVLRTVDSLNGMMTAGETRGFLVRGETTDLSDQGGSIGGCLVPTEAVAVAMHFRVRSQLPNVVGRLFAGRTGGPGALNRALEYLRQGPEGHVGMSIVGLCEGICTSDFDLRATGVGVNIRGDVVGFFRPIEAGDVPGGISGGDADTLDGLDSTDFALVSHTHDGGDITSGTVGEPFIDSLVTRDDEVVGIVKDNDGSGSGIDADLLDGRDSLDLMLQVGNCLTVSANCPAAAPDALAARCWPTISAALAAINGTDLPLATAMNRYVIKVGPGIYNEQVTMLPFVDIEGAGQKVTTVTFASDGIGTFIGADNAELRSLTAESTGAGSLSVAMKNSGVAPMLKQVTLRASGGTVGNIAMVNDNGATPTLTHVTAVAAAETGLDEAVSINNSSVVEIRDSVLEGDNDAVLTANGSTARIVDTQIIGPANKGAGMSTLTCLGAFDSAFTELGTDCQP